MPTAAHGIWFALAGTHPCLCAGGGDVQATRSDASQRPDAPENAIYS